MLLHKCNNIQNVTLVTRLLNDSVTRQCFFLSLCVFARVSPTSVNPNLLPPFFSSQSQSSSSSSPALPPLPPPLPPPPQPERKNPPQVTTTRCPCIAQHHMSLRLLSHRAVRAFMMPRRGLDDFVTGSAPPPAAAKGKDAAKGEQAADATAAGRSWKAMELRRMYRVPLSAVARHPPSCPLPLACTNAMACACHVTRFTRTHDA